MRTHLQSRSNEMKLSDSTDKEAEDGENKKWRTKSASNKQIFTMKYPTFMARTERAFVKCVISLYCAYQRMACFGTVIVVRRKRLYFAHE